MFFLVFFSIRRRHTRCALVTGVQTCALPIFLHFVERNYAGDPINWWIPNAACTQAMLRSSCFRIAAHPEDEVYLCQVAERPWGAEPVYPRPGDRQSVV